MRSQVTCYFHIIDILKIMFHINNILKLASDSGLL